MDLSILQIISTHTGIKVLGIKDELEKINVSISLDQVRNSIKRKIYDFIEYKGSRKTGGYYFKG
ncbi:MAG: hypothetical protein EOM50_02130 [Erysipelotrichia bacterium]|nr:hypothetical protein [Erysipelotrichia bacterium]